MAQALMSCQLEPSKRNLDRLSVRFSEVIELSRMGAARRCPSPVVAPQPFQENTVALPPRGMVYKVARGIGMW